MRLLRTGVGSVSYGAASIPLGVFHLDVRIVFVHRYCIHDSDATGLQDASSSTKTNGNGPRRNGRNATAKKRYVSRV